MSETKKYWVSISEDSSTIDVYRSYDELVKIISLGDDQMRAGPLILDLYDTNLVEQEFLHSRIISVTIAFQDKYKRQTGLI